jgi:hypothetical protein
VDGQGGKVFAAGGPVRDQPDDRQVGLGVVLTAADPALQGPPPFGLGDGMLDADPLMLLLRVNC